MRNLTTLMFMIIAMSLANAGRGAAFAGNGAASFEAPASDGSYLPYPAPFVMLAPLPTR